MWKLFHRLKDISIQSQWKNIHSLPNCLPSLLACYSRYPWTFDLAIRFEKNYDFTKLIYKYIFGKKNFTFVYLKMTLNEPIQTFQKLYMSLLSFKN